MKPPERRRPRLYLDGNGEKINLLEMKESMETFYTHIDSWCDDAQEANDRTEQLRGLCSVLEGFCAEGQSQIAPRDLASTIALFRQELDHIVSHMNEVSALFDNLRDDAQKRKEASVEIVLKSQKGR